MAKKTEQPQTLSQLKASLREQKTDRLYIFYGEEAFLRNHYLGQMKKLLIDELTESFNYHKLTKENFDLQAFADAVESLPMMAESTFVVVDDIDIYRLPEADREKLMGIFTDIPEYCTVVFTYDAVEWRPDRRLNKFHNCVTENATIVEFAKQEQRELVNWITRHFAANKKRITPELCCYLIDITGGTMTALASEISKICAFSGAENIVKSDIDAVTEPVLDAAIFQMTEMLGRGDCDGALRSLRQLIMMQEEPLSILGAIGGHCRRISTARTLLDHGKNYTDYVNLYKGGDYAAKKTMGAAKRFSPRFCAKAAELVLETDVGIKTSRDEPQRLLEILILQLAQEVRNG